ncbi:GNAT family N-acetyltransferase [Chitinimonas arctica]|uniref:GNAT family N-acetyltransferase n=1 Tax=Chitinimonas arctica TaxID=2594795 RepID=A0A516SJQ3_9NEIS|nr:GNAT family N-acetyltransferase [Chitinimonas arctica]QDQ28391.1 GNAT family N-acetyltransferase [Chitinimonas arctica]
MPNSEANLVCRLQLADLPAIQAHLLALDGTDRLQRFSSPASDETIVAYVRRLDFTQDALFGVWREIDCRLVLAGLTHLAIDPANRMAELGVSVATDQRRRGIAGRMLQRAILHARNVGVEEVAMYFLPYNTELIELAKTLSMKLSAGEGQGTAKLRPATADFVSFAGEMVESWSELAGRSLRDWSGGTLAASETLKRLGSPP